MIPGASTIEPIRRIEPLAGNWRSAQWHRGAFDTAGRAFTPDVEGIIRTPDHVLMVTLSGGAELLEVKAECGHSYHGSDRRGAVSFVPAGLTRHLKMRGVQSSWASISLDPSLVQSGRGGVRGALPPFSNREDRFVAACLETLTEQMRFCGSIDPLYGEAISLAVAQHLVARYGNTSPAPARLHHLPKWKCARIDEFIDANIGNEIRIADLAALVGLSVGHFHRAFRATHGCTPLTYIHRCRIARAQTLLAETDWTIATVAAHVGFPGPSHFARTFRQIKGIDPRDVRRSLRFWAPETVPEKSENIK